MANMLDGGMTIMTDKLLSYAGTSCKYVRGSASHSVTARKSTMVPVLVDNGQGQILEVRPIDFLFRTSDLPYAIPQRGDQIEMGGSWFEVMPPLGSEKVFRQITPAMTRVHTKQVS